MADEHNEFFRVRTLSGVNAPLKDVDHAARQASLTTDYLALPGGQPIMVIRDGVMTFALKPAKPMPNGTLFLTERGYEFPVEVHVRGCVNEQIATIDGPVVITVSELMEAATEVLFGEEAILKRARETAMSAVVFCLAFAAGFSFRQFEDIR